MEASHTTHRANIKVGKEAEKEVQVSTTSSYLEYLKNLIRLRLCRHWVVVILA